jgi:hypothetical protein
MTSPSNTRPVRPDPDREKQADITSDASKPTPADRRAPPKGAAPSNSERTYHPDTTARPIPSGADPMEYRRPHPQGQPVRSDQSADPPDDEQIHPADKR